VLIAMPVSGAPSLFSETYKPLVGGVACWPAHPIALKCSQSAARSRRTLLRMRGPFYTIATFALEFALSRCSTGILLHPQASQEHR
jgi:hypothetical protein